MIILCPLGDALADQRDQPFSAPDSPQPNNGNVGNPELDNSTSKSPQVTVGNPNALTAFNNVWTNWRRWADMESIEMKMRPMNFHVGTSYSTLTAAVAHRPFFP